jgi:hypothetical protein
VVSLWLVQDETTAELVTLFYQHLSLGQSRGTALREAQLSLKSRMSHPYYWAPFILVGHYQVIAGILQHQRLNTASPQHFCYHNSTRFNNREKHLHKSNA